MERSPDSERQRWHELAQQLRVDSIRSSAVTKSGHPTSSMSAADLMAVLLAKYLRYDFDRPDDPANDHLIFSKGHASPLLYSMFKAAGAIGDDELLTLRRFGSRLQGHPTPIIPWVDVATGSLGQGLPIAVGVALAGKRLDQIPYRIWTLCGDSEMAEGSMWEAAEQAAFLGLDNLTAIVDVNRLGQRGETMYGWHVEVYAERLRAFGWQVATIDGHDLDAIDGAYQAALGAEGRPFAIVAKTVKGKGVKRVENQNGYHGKALDDPGSAIAELGGERRIVVPVARPEGRREYEGQPRFESGKPELPRYQTGSEVATRKAYGEALAAVAAADGAVVVLDAEVSNSTYAEIPGRAHPDRYFEMYIAEQQMLATAVGLQVRGWKPFASTFGAFFTRAFDFIRMAAVSQADLRLCGSHAGVSIGEDGPSQMALEDIAMMRAVHGSTVLYPCDANQTARLVAAMAGHEGISYLRTTRGATRVIYGPDEDFPIGGSRVVRSSADDEVTLVGAGITLHAALAAAEALDKEGIRARVIDCYSVKPIDVQTLHAAARDTGRIVTVEDHWAEGGLGEAVLAALVEAGALPRVVVLAVRRMPGSGTPADMVTAAGIDAEHIARAARRLVAEPRPTGASRGGR